MPWENPANILCNSTQDLSGLHSDQSSACDNNLGLHRATCLIFYASKGYCVREQRLVFKIISWCLLGTHSGVPAPTWEPTPNSDPTGDADKCHGHLSGGEGHSSQVPEDFLAGLSPEGQGSCKGAISLKNMRQISSIGNWECIWNLFLSLGISTEQKPASESMHLSLPVPCTSHTPLGFTENTMRLQIVLVTGPCSATR